MARWVSSPTRGSIRNASFKDVTAPNADTLYSSAFLDPEGTLRPEHSRRTWTLLHDAHAERLDDSVPGTGHPHDRNQAQKYLISGPGWTGAVPDGVTQHKSETNMVWIIGRTYCTGTPQAYAAVHAIQDQYKLVPLSSYRKPYTAPPGKVDPSIDMKTPVRDQVNNMDVNAYFNLLATLMKDNPPTPEDAPMVARMAKIGLVPGQRFDSAKLGPEAVTALQSVPKDASGKIMANFKDIGTMVNGWLFSTKMGNLWHRLSDTSDRHSYWIGSEPPAGCCISDL